MRPDTADKVILFAFMLVFLVALWIFRADHDVVVALLGLMTTTLGGLLGLLRGSVHTNQTNEIQSGSSPVITATTLPGETK